MKWKFLIILLVVASIFVLGGKLYSDYKHSVRESEEFDFRMMKVPEAQLEFLKTLDTSLFLPPKFESGTYVLEIQMPRGEVICRDIEIPFKDNNFAFVNTNALVSRVGFHESAKMEGHVVSWHDEGVLYDIGVEYIGVVSGSHMYGHVYNYIQTPKGEVGFWRLFPKLPAK
jgi:hypothetical protein